ncbi:hypothetical protein, partial [Paraburkholderia sp. RL17-373-BIF-A]|uniref:hypothetical protein n=1 Tax=Paraburkholderia sp. RL17-373-BIF-A TaxID=3031629 RepID=UPI0038BC4E02
AALAGQIRGLPEGNRQAAFDNLLVAVHELDMAGRGQPLAALAGQIGGLLPEGNRQAAFDNLLVAVRELDVAGRGQPLAALGRQTNALPG